MSDSVNVLEVGRRFAEALDEGLDPFTSLAQQWGYTPLQAHDHVRVYQVFSKVSKQINVTFQTLSHQAASVNLPKLALIAPVIEKAPHTCKAWLDLAQDLPLQDLIGPVRQALQGLQRD